MAQERLSVRGLVEFTLHGEDIAPSGSLRDMQEGVLGHKARQQALAEGWQAEVPLSLTVPADEETDLVIAGRMDAFRPGDPPAVEEIKLWQGRIPPEAPLPAHRMQAVVYGHILCATEGLARVAIRVAYVTRRGQPVALFPEELTAAACAAAFAELLENWLRRRRLVRTHARLRDAGLRRLRFPFDVWRPGQREMAAQVWTAIRLGRRLLAAMPTGTGKSAAALYPALKALGEKYDNLVVLDADLAGATKTATFQKAFPERHFDCGIAEANMTAVAAGLSTTGLVPFVSSFAMFAAGRAFEQVRNSIGYPHLNVKIGATHAGISVGEDGASHQCNEDLALMRAIPGMVVINPADDVEARAAVEAAYHYVGPVYLRFGRLAVPVINDRPDYKFELGKGIVLREGKDLTIIANGLCVAPSLEAAEKLAEEGIDAKVINIHTIKPLDTELVIAAAKETGKVVTVEEHSVIGGLGGAVCECLAEAAPVPVKRIGIYDVFGESGAAAALLEKYGLDGKGVCESVKEFIRQ